MQNAKIKMAPPCRARARTHPVAGPERAASRLRVRRRAFCCPRRPATAEAVGPRARPCGRQRALESRSAREAGAESSVRVCASGLSVVPAREPRGDTMICRRLFCVASLLVLCSTAEARRRPCSSHKCVHSILYWTLALRVCDIRVHTPALF